MDGDWFIAVDIVVVIGVVFVVTKEVSSLAFSSSVGVTSLL